MLQHKHRAYATPERRSDCPPPSSPCPHVGCRHNTFLDVGADGRLHILDRVPVLDPRRGSGCALWEEHSQQGLADRWGVARSEIWRIEDAALAKVLAALSQDAARALMRLVAHRRRLEDGEEANGDSGASDTQDAPLDAGADS